jgi:hypothetical protein
MMSGIILRVILLSVIMPSVTTPIDIMLTFIVLIFVIVNDTMLSVVLIVVAPKKKFYKIVNSLRLFLRLLEALRLLLPF